MGFAHGTDHLVFESGDKQCCFFRGQSPRYDWVWRGRLKSWGDGFQTTFLYLKLHVTTFLNLVILIVNHGVIIIWSSEKGAGSKSGGLGGVDTYFRT